MSNEVLVAKNSNDVNFWHLCSLRGALRLEMTGMTRRGQSALSVAKQKFGLKRNATAKQAFDAVQAEIDRLLEEKHQ
jgi:hypothetical protein